jgi:aspartyl protease
VNFGTPPQPVYVQLDTGSFELWVNPDCTAVRPSDQTFCEATGSYNPSTSTTSKTLQRGNSLQYGIGTANISYVVDDMSFAGGPNLAQVQFGVATQTTDQFAGILGLGHGLNFSTPYPNVMDQLATQGAIRTKAFSLALGSKAEEMGTLVLGGIDTAKFSGPLAAMPVIPAEAAPDKVARYWVSLQSIAITPPSGRSIQFPGSTLPVFLDSGATLTLLPRQLSDAIATSFGSPGLDSREFYPVDCSLVTTQGTVDFQFAGTTIKVPYNEMIRETTRRDGTKSCMLGIVPSPDFVLLGDTFLRSAYAVFDLDAEMIYMAQYVNCGSRVMEIRNSQSIGPVVGLCPDPLADTTPAPSNGTAGQTDGTADGVNGALPSSASLAGVSGVGTGLFMAAVLTMLLNN